ncbi:hypothetical protein CASFOL_023063 [Castilleja foliolosa]|uniref:Uncharacterized protein n=1 Tax=Castilleja foliolosa TaxID=1961234 RepID=A0ABD3CLJ0_9LAMI
MAPTSSDRESSCRTVVAGLATGAIYKAAAGPMSASVSDIFIDDDEDDSQRC